MTSLHQIIAQASEYATSVTTDMSASDLQNLGSEMNALMSQLTSVVNQKLSDGNYIFGGTANQAPLSFDNGTFNAAHQRPDATSIDAAAGQFGADQHRRRKSLSGSPAVDGFLYDSTSGVDVVASLQQAITDLNAGNASAVQTTDLPALNKALDHISSYVGSTAASMAAVQTAANTTTQQLTSDNNQLNALTQTNLPNATVQLQQIQMQYQATLQAGSRILGLSILNYLPTS